jgi:predicted class III extradiol MEMO1 family dioxygenase
MEHRDFATIMAPLGDIRIDVETIRALLEESDGEEEDPEADS